MASFLHSFAAWIFYALGISFFIAYMLMTNGIATPWPQFWLSVADLPVLLIGMLYGGTSLYLSVKQPNSTSPILASVIGAPLVALFIILVLLNFWPALIAALANS